jgi:hypothetical protein
MMDPFKIEGPAIINVSGGRTSAYMLRRILDAHDGRLPDDVHAVFANTGKEFPETLEFVAECAERWEIRIDWVERDKSAPGGFVVVTPESASRHGEPFDNLIRDKKYLPNTFARFCTQDLKIKPARAYMIARGYEMWTSYIGLRYDEQRRVANVLGVEGNEWTVRCPLHSARVVRKDVDAYWKASPFDLRLKPWESNCDGCFNKNHFKLERTERDRPGTLSWWHEWETHFGRSFHGQRRYLDLIQAASQPLLIGVDDSDDGDILPCNCTD